MLVKFAVTNYRGFANRIEWDLSKPSNYSFNTFAIKDGIIKNGIVYGLMVLASRTLQWPSSTLQIIFHRSGRR